MIQPPKREPTMTIACKDCSFEYGRWRPRCPACGTLAPDNAMKPFNPPAQLAPRREREPKQPRADGCVLCQRRVKPKQEARCPHCNERVHKNCLPLHQVPCQTFQQGRQDELKRLGMS